jgi:16S rRNA (guanine(966)-N(2))-methyltransferase RsmD
VKAWITIWLACRLCWLAMRIIAGTYRSRPLGAPPGLSTRPTSDRLRETLFNVLAPHVVARAGGAVFLDLFAGSGAVGLEALSRGAGSVTFVERDPAALEVLRGNLARLGIRGGVRVHAGSVSGFLRSEAKAAPNAERSDIVFLDPPYDAAQQYAAVLALLGGSGCDILAPGALVVAEHRRKLALDERYGSLRRTRLLEQGDAALSFFAVDPAAEK